MSTGPMVGPGGPLARKDKTMGWIHARDDAWTLGGGWGKDLAPEENVQLIIQKLERVVQNLQRLYGYIPDTDGVRVVDRYRHELRNPSQREHLFHSSPNDEMVVVNVEQPVPAFHSVVLARGLCKCGKEIVEAIYDHELGALYLCDECP